MLTPPIFEKRRILYLCLLPRFLGCFFLVVPLHQPGANKSARARLEGFCSKPAPDSGQRRVTRLAASGRRLRLSPARLPLRAAEYLNEDIYYNRDTED